MRRLVLPIETERLVIRALTSDDLERHHVLYSNPSVVRYLYAEPLDIDAARTHLARRLSSELPFEGSPLNLAVDVHGVMVGEVFLGVVSSTHRVCEVGYVFDPEVHGRGYATEASVLMVEIAFTVLDAHRVMARLDARNTASAKVLERLGMVREAHLRENEFVKGEWTDEVDYAILEDEWRAAHPRGHRTLYVDVV